MRQTGVCWFAVIVMLFTGTSTVMAATDGFYTLVPTTFAWDGTDENRQKPPTADYSSTYGDEAGLTYTLPWSFPFYGQSYNQISADTNGNIWFGGGGSAHSFSLGSNGHGPVIALWNHDLSSYYSGGVFVQHKTGPERIVVEWQTETYSNEGRRKPDTFEAVLYPTGAIRVDYKAFTQSSTNKDFGSGISLNDGKFFINLTGDQGNVFDLSGKSYSITQTGASKTLTVNFTGDGTGTVASTLGTFWTANATTHLPANSMVTLTALPAINASFIGWSGPCTGTGICTFSLGQDLTVSAQFSTRAQQALDTTSGIRNVSLQTAYNEASDGTALKLRATNFNESLNANQAKTVTLSSGFDATYTIREETAAALAGDLTVTDGTVVIDGLQLGNTESGPSFLAVTTAGTGSGTVTSIPTGIVCGIACGASFPANTPVTLSARPNSGSIFVGWSGGGCSGSGNCIAITNDSTTAITAIFNRLGL